MPKMTEEKIKAVLAQEIRQSIAYNSDTISAERATALAYYQGDLDEFPYQPGRSKVVDRTVLETVEWMMPALMDVFTGNDGIVEFESIGQDQQEAKQATEMARHVLFVQNDGYRILHDFAKDGLLQKNGVIKWWFETTNETREEVLASLDENTFVAIASDPTVEVLEHSAEVDPEAMPEVDMAGQIVMPMRHDIRIKVTEEKSQIVINVVPPEEFFINRLARDIDGAHLVAHKVRKTYSDLLEEGYPKSVVDEVPYDTDDDWDWSEEATERYKDLDFIGSSVSLDKASRKAWVWDAYVKIDEDGDGIAELRRIVFAGDASNMVILSDEPVDHIPFAVWSPIRLPHRVIGLSEADITMDLQAVNTAIIRGALDGIYLANNPRYTALENSVNMDDLLTSAPGSVVRTRAPNAVMPLVTQNPAPQAIQMLEYVGKIRTMRTGINEQTVGLSPESMVNTSATAASLASNSSQMRTKLIARNMADGVKQLYMGIYKTLMANQAAVQELMIGKQPVAVDPSAWKGNARVRVQLTDNVLDKTRSLTFLGQILSIQRETMMAMGPQNPLAGMKQVYNTLQNMVEVMDIGPVEEFFLMPPDQMPPQPQKPDPEMMKVQAEMQMKQAEMQMKAQSEQQRARADMAIQQQKAQQEAENMRYKAELEAQLAREKADMEMRLAAERMAMEERLKSAELQAEAQLEMLKMQAGSRDGQGNIPEVL